MGAPTALDSRIRPSPLQLWIGILAGPGAWAADLGISYALVRWSCSSQRIDVLRLVSVGAFAVAVAGGLLSCSQLRQLARDAPLVGYSEHRVRFMALLGVAASALFTLAIMAFAIPRWILDACQ